MYLDKFVHSNTGKILMSLLLGIGLATFFRSICKGKNCRIIFCGDFRQSDFTYDKDKKGLIDFMKILQNMKAFNFIDFNVDDIVRSSLVKEYIIAKDRLQITA